MEKTQTSPTPVPSSQTTPPAAPADSPAGAVQIVAPAGIEESLTSPTKPTEQRFSLADFGVTNTRATFVAEDRDDVEVRVFIDGEGAMSATISYGEGAKVPPPVLTPAKYELQAAEALQFVSDTLGARVPGRLPPFVRGWISVAADSHETAKQHGFWEDERNDGEMIALMHSELSEMLEALRKNPDGASEKIPEFTEVEEEAADLVIRLMDFGHARGLRIAQAILAKQDYNDGRPYKHGKRF